MKTNNNEIKINNNKIKTKIIICCNLVVVVFYYFINYAKDKYRNLSKEKKCKKRK